MKKYKTLFIDLDDTLWDTRTNTVTGIRFFYNDYNLGQIYDSFDSFFSLFSPYNNYLWELYHHGQIQKEELIVRRFQYPFEAKGIYKTQEEALQMNRVFLDYVASQATLVPDAHELLEYLYPRYCLCILSNGFNGIQQKKMRSSGIEHFFSHVFLSDTIGYNKPHPHIYRHALSTTNSKKCDTLMIGDNFDTDITGAHNIRMDQLYFMNGKDYAETFTPTYKVNSLKEIFTLL